MGVGRARLLRLLELNGKPRLDLLLGRCRGNGWYGTFEPRLLLEQCSLQSTEERTVLTHTGRGEE